MTIYERLEELGCGFSGAPAVGGIYRPVKQSGSLLYVSGQGSVGQDGVAVTGKAGAGRTVEEAREAAKLCVINALRALHFHLGDLGRVAGVVKILGFVASAPGFTDQPKVIDAASALLRDIWGEDGIGARSAIAANELPGGITVEIEFIFELKA